jgi:hypothetical protein
MMRSAQDWHGEHATHCPGVTWKWCVLLQRKVRATPMGGGQQPSAVAQEYPKIN